jgi:hypothetical protein
VCIMGVPAVQVAQADQLACTGPQSAVGQGQVTGDQLCTEAATQALGTKRS